MKVIFYEVDNGWESYYTLDEKSALAEYNSIDDPCKRLIKFEANVTPEYFMTILNHGFDDRYDKHIVQYILMEPK